MTVVPETECIYCGNCISSGGNNAEMDAYSLYCKAANGRKPVKISSWLHWIGSRPNWCPQKDGVVGDV